ncbi:MAG: type II toxin-antitoxin system PemK/MazF family toxin [Phycisphaerales bacterium]|nr:type II toxin-antitoxin system PemK/MazF family toxin [Phycisphaerae bacterium]NNF41452.1 type II toxin-antitoxin system PemK/MazF family toxin [Phycisphaerales bacterium]NNM24982.1 type II toxin-antitoxin system PemK/MazF family toxin [Phycisphaerales bacterium]
MQRGDIWWASAATPKDPEPGNRQPVLIVQVNAFNRSNIPTVLVATVTSNVDLAEAPGNVQLTRKQSRLPKSSVVDVSRIFTLDRRHLIERVGQIPTKQMTAVEDGLRLTLAL